VARAERRRCATYTRKSSEEGLEQDFNSLDAQREACEAYIQSQAGEGWRPVRMRYDDGGQSGGTLSRPALERLLGDIEAGKIDTVVVYKVDRLTRSLSDFAKIVEIFDANGVSFVSVTQHFNTTTSMGRLTLNMLLSFAQFEREVTGERIRDKIAASKRKGLWMGGLVPLGYEASGRTLVIHEPEAETVRTVFRLYLERGSVQTVKEEADRLGLRSKVRRGPDGKRRGGRLLSRGYLHQLLRNPLYIGRIRHRGEVHPGQHEAIIDPETWAAVQAKLSSQAPPPAASPRARRPSSLRGKLFDEAGERLTPSHTVKSGRRYRYYVSRAVGRKRRGASGWRLPALEIERAVEQAVVALLNDPATLAEDAREAGISETQTSHLHETIAGGVAVPLDLVQRVDLDADGLGLTLDLGRFIGVQKLRIHHQVPLRIRRRGVEQRLVIASKSADDSQVDAALVKSLVRSRRWFQDLAEGRAAGIAEIARKEAISDRYISNLIPIAFLSPKIVGDILRGTQAPELTAELLKRTPIPRAWAEQEEVWTSARLHRARQATTVGGAAGRSS
jgi:DNA invertase Pin-like site-specific DNA recombinase